MIRRPDRLGLVFLTLFFSIALSLYWTFAGHRGAWVFFLFPVIVWPFGWRH